MSQQRTPEEEAIGPRAKALAGDATKQFVDKANERGAEGMSSVGRRLDEAAEYVRSRGADAAERIQVDPKHADSMADRIHGAASYLQDRDPKSAFGDFDDAIQRHPYRALAAGAAIGYLVGRFFRRD
jgi:ElaB/YqjD/DUF883 family membrane-anchored ribosome-binding protein